MAVTIIRPGTRVLTVGSPGVRISQPIGGAGWSPADWWTVAGKTCYCAYQAKGAPSLALSYTNLASPGVNDAGVGVAPTFDTLTGWTFGGGSYLTTTFVPNTDRTQSMLVQFTNYPGNDYGILAGAWTGAGFTGRFWVSPDWAAPGCNWDNNFSTAPVIAPVVTNGNLCVAGIGGYRDGVWKGNGNTLSSSAMTFPVWIGGINNNGALSNNYAFKLQAFAIYSDTLTAGEVATVSAAMAAL